MITTFENALVSGIFDADVVLATGYPGFPITTIVEKLMEGARKNCPGLMVRWCINEVTALEKAIGACLAGARSIALMKNHGTNTIQDDLINLSYIGTPAGMLIISADDIGVRASHNESDSRQFGPLNMVPVIEPATVDDAYHFISYGFEISEQFHTPVIIRVAGKQLPNTDKISARLNSKTPLAKRYEFNPEGRKFFIGPKHYSRMKALMINRIMDIQALGSNRLNQIRTGNSNPAFICSGACYNKVIDLFPDASVLKLGMSYPIIHQDLEQFFSSLSGSGEVWVIEETTGLIEYQVIEYLYRKGTKNLVLRLCGKDRLGLMSEITETELLTKIKGIKYSPFTQEINITPHAAEVKLCPACPARAVLLSLKEIGVKVIGDAGCTALGCLYPFESVHAGICMGSSIAVAAGINMVAKEQVVALIGDSAFFHGGILGILNEIGNSNDLLVIIFNNYASGLTGGQTINDGIQASDSSSERMKNILRDAGITEQNLAVFRNSLDLSRVKSEIIRFYYFIKGIRVLIIEGDCPYQLNDFHDDIEQKTDSVRIINRAMVNPGCFACEHVSDQIYRIYQTYCGACKICDELIIHD